MVKKQLLTLAIAGITVHAFGQTPFEKKNLATDLALKTMKYDFPKETIGKNGGGYSLDPEKLAKPVKRIALVTFFLEDVGMAAENELLDVAKAWRTSDALAQQHINGFYQQGIEALQKSFTEGGMELLLPGQFLDTPEKKEYFKNYVVEHTPFKKEKKEGARAVVSSSYDSGYLTYTTTTIASVDRIKVTAEGQDWKPLFFINEATYTKSFKGDPLPMTFQTIGLYDKKQANSMGYDLVNELGVDAVLAVYIVTNKLKKNKEIYAVRSISGYMWGPNPIQREEGNDKGLIYTRGIFYGGARAFYGSGLVFQDEKDNPQPSYKGMESAMAAMGKRLTHYLNTGKRK